MAQTIQLKRSSTSGATPSAGSLSAGELAVNTADGKVFLKKANGSVVSIINQDTSDTRYLAKANSTSTVDSLFDTVGGLAFTLPSTVYGNATGGIGEAVNNGGGIGVSARLTSDQRAVAMLTVEPTQITIGVQGDSSTSLSYLVQSKNDFTFSQQYGTKLWTNASILTRSYADARYAGIGSSGGIFDGGSATSSDNTFDGGSATG